MTPCLRLSEPVFHYLAFYEISRIGELFKIDYFIFMFIDEVGRFSVSLSSLRLESLPLFSLWRHIEKPKVISRYGGL